MVITLIVSCLKISKAKLISDLYKLKKTLELNQLQMWWPVQTLSGSGNNMTLYDVQMWFVKNFDVFREFKIPQVKIQLPW